MSKYLGITIGPIYDTITQARKTREVWLGSFFFSHVMKLIVKFFKSKEREYGTFYAMYTDLIDSDETFHGAGIYNDRCYVKLSDGKYFMKKDYEALCNYVIDEFELSNLKIENRELLEQYLRIYCTVQVIDEEKNALGVLNKHLDNMELQAKYYPNYIYALASGHEERHGTIKDKGILPNSVKEIENWYALGFAQNRDSLDRKNRFKKDELVYYNIENGIFSFPSILEISTKGLERKYVGTDKNYGEIHLKFEQQLHQEIRKQRGEDIKKEEKITDESILSKIKDLYKNDFQTAHKYIAIVQADGDNVGKLITELSETKSDALESFSKNLITYGIKAAELIHNYGGKPVYIGGDDLFFFAPVVSCDEHEKKKTNIFNLLKDLDKAFDEIWQIWLEKHNIEKIIPHLSYGLSITYYKYPMNESIDLAKSLLKAAKEYPDVDEPQKNSIAIQLMTHSGSFDRVILNKGEESTFDKLIKLLENFGEKDRETIVASVLQRLRTDESLLLTIAKDDASVDFTAYFDNEYDLDNEKDPNKREYVDASKALFFEIFAANNNKEEALKQLCTLYRLLNFLIHKEQ
jgi:CRISPR-associated protein Cmr2